MPCPPPPKKNLKWRPCRKSKSFLNSSANVVDANLYKCIHSFNWVIFIYYRAESNFIIFMSRKALCNSPLNPHNASLLLLWLPFRVEQDVALSFQRSSKMLVWNQNFERHAIDCDQLRHNNLNRVFLWWEKAFNFLSLKLMERTAIDYVFSLPRVANKSIGKVNSNL